MQINKVEAQKSPKFGATCNFTPEAEKAIKIALREKLARQLTETERQIYETQKFSLKKFIAGFNRTFKKVTKELDGNFEIKTNPENNECLTVQYTDLRGKTLESDYLSKNFMTYPNNYKSPRKNKYIDGILNMLSQLFLFNLPEKGNNQKIYNLLERICNESAPLHKKNKY